MADCEMAWLIGSQDSHSGGVTGATDGGSVVRVNADVARQRTVPRWLATASHQCGLINISQLRAAGIERNGLQSLCAAHRLQGLLPGVYAIPGHPHSWWRDAWALHLWAGDGSALSGAAAARCFGIDGFGKASLELSMTGRKRHYGMALPSRRAYSVRRVDRHLLAQIVRVDGLPVTDLPRTFIDLAGRRDLRAARLLDQSLARGMCDLGRFCLLVEEQWMRGRRGVAVARDLLLPRLEGQGPTDSELENEALRLIKRIGLPPPAVGHPVEMPWGLIHIDLAYPEIRFGIELDGYAWHSGTEEFERDRERDNYLALRDWRIIRLTWSKLRWDRSASEGLVRDLYHSLTAKWRGP